MIDVVALVLTLAGFATAGYGIQLVRGGAREPWLRRRLGQAAYAAAWLLFAATVAAMLADAALLAAAAGLSAGVCALTRQAIVRGAPLPPGRAARRGPDGRFLPRRTYGFGGWEGRTIAAGSHPSVELHAAGEPADPRREAMLVHARHRLPWPDMETGKLFTVDDLRAELWPLPEGVTDTDRIRWEQAWRGVDAGDVSQEEAERASARLTSEAPGRLRPEPVRRQPAGTADDPAPIDMWHHGWAGQTATADPWGPYRREQVRRQVGEQDRRQWLAARAADSSGRVCAHGYPVVMGCAGCERRGSVPDAHGHRGACPDDLSYLQALVASGSINHVAGGAVYGMPSGVNVTGAQLREAVYGVDSKLRVLLAGHAPAPRPARPGQRASNRLWRDYLRHGCGCDHPREAVERMTKAELIAHAGEHEHPSPISGRDWLVVRGAGVTVVELAGVDDVPPLRLDAADTAALRALAAAPATGTDYVVLPSGVHLSDELARSIGAAIRFNEGPGW
jgi:hypothetical protein